MKRSTAFFVLIAFTLAIFSSFHLNINVASAQSPNYSIQRVDHQIEVMYSGHLIIRDTIHVTGQLSDGFLIGFPKKYGAYVLKGAAYNADSILPMSLNLPFEGHSDLYGASISFPQETPQVFTVIFILSNELVYQNNSLSAAAVEFPAYPSLAKEAAYCNATVVLPDFASNILLTKNDGTLSTTSYTKENLAAFTSSPANVTFSIPVGILQIFSVTNLNRAITLSPAGDVVSSDSYGVVNNGNDSLVAFGADVPLNASNIIGMDDLGRSLSVEVVGTGSTFQLVNVTFKSPLTRNQATLLKVQYTLPKLPSEGITNFAVNFDIFPYFDYYITQASVIIIPPEGAQFLSIDPAATLNREGLQETLAISKAGISHIDLDVPYEAAQITYSYNPLWLSFRPTLWMWLIVAVGCVIIVIWRRRKPSALPRTTALKIPISRSPDSIRAFIDAYEDKTRVTSELKLLYARVQKNKIPRRQYKLQKRRLDAHLATLSKDISESKATLSGANSNFASLVRQLDVAEDELNEAEKNNRNVESRFKINIISAEEYKKLLADFQRRKAEAETAINGFLLRLREETR